VDDAALMVFDASLNTNMIVDNVDMVTVLIIPWSLVLKGPATLTKLGGMSMGSSCSMTETVFHRHVGMAG